MRDADEGVVLTEREREALASLAESIGDPWLARQLAGHDLPPVDVKRRRPRPGLPTLRLPALSGWAGLALVVAGAVLAVATFAHSTLVASLALAIMGFGTWRFVADKGDQVIARLNEHRTRATAPQTAPHTPPAAE